MPHALFFTDLEEGHFLASAGLAKRIRAKGYGVTYLSLADSEAMVRQQGFDFIAMMPELLPRGMGRRIRERCAEDLNGAMTEAQNLYFGSLVNGRALDQIMARLKPDVVCALSLYPTEALVIRLRYHVPVILLTPMIPTLSRAERYKEVTHVLMNMRSGVREFLDLVATSGARIRSLQDLTQLALEMPELVLLPKAFDLIDASNEPHLFFIGSGLDLSREEEGSPMENLDRGNPLIYCSLGSQCSLKAEVVRRFFQAVIEAAMMSPEWQFALSISHGFDKAEFQAKSSNIIVENWLPQLAMLSRARVLLTHAGIGTVREAIALGVPMIGYPLMRDQFCAAEAITKHGIGVQADITNVTPLEIRELIGRVIGDSGMLEKIRSMQGTFAETDALDEGIRVIESVIYSCQSEGVNHQLNYDE